MNKIIQFLFKSFSMVFESNDTQTTLETFCKTINVHNKNLGFFIQCYDSELLNNWLNLIKQQSNFTIIKINKQTADILIKTNTDTSFTLFNFIKSWQSNFGHKDESVNTTDSLENRFDESYQWIHIWMSKYLTDLSKQEYVIKNTIPKLLDKQTIQAIGVQQNIKQSLIHWNKQDSTWWLNIKADALAIAFLSHNINNQQLSLKINFELLTSDTTLNPKVKFEHLLIKQNDLISNRSKQIQLLFLNFEINCLNACTFFKPYKLLYAMIEFDREYTKLST
ncbi:MAG: hypothetical protein HRU38_20520 [Saccharospirillaceae bacterium]|nr:hypothetical protein [Pseudomonadales bacterium]NRB81018.1 hypothetical protein [Saccharospirillaceae bacterium]